MVCAELAVSSASNLEVLSGTTVAVKLDGLSGLSGQESEEGNLASVVGSLDSCLWCWVVSEWHTVLLAPPAGAVGSLGNLGLGSVYAGLNSVFARERVKVAVDFDGIGFASLVGVNPVETVVEVLAGFLGSEVEVEAGPGRALSVLAGRLSDVFDLAGEYLECAEDTGGVGGDHAHVVDGGI